MSQELTDTTFDEYVKSSDKPVLIDFWAEWCGPCKLMTPVLNDIDMTADDVSVVSVDVENNPNLGKRFDIRSIPTFVVTKDGYELGRTSGAMSKSALTEWYTGVIE